MPTFLGPRFLVALRGASPRSLCFAQWKVVKKVTYGLPTNPGLARTTAFLADDLDQLPSLENFIMRELPLVGE